MLVLNAGRIAGEAANTSYRLTTHGYTTKKLPAGDQANAPKVTSNTIVYYDPVQAGREGRRPQQLAPLFGSHTQVEQMTTVISGLREPGRQSADGRRGRDELPRHAHHPEAAEGARRSSRRR